MKTHRKRPNPNRKVGFCRTILKFLFSTRENTISQSGWEKKLEIVRLELCHSRCGRSTTRASLQDRAPHGRVHLALSRVLCAHPLNGAIPTLRFRAFFPLSWVSPTPHNDNQACTRSVSLQGSPMACYWVCGCVGMWVGRMRFAGGRYGIRRKLLPV